MPALVKQFCLKSGIAVLRFFYAAIKRITSVQEKKYLFVTKAANEQPLDFRLLEKELKKRHPECSVVMLCKTMDNKIRYIPHIFVQMYHFATSQVVFLDRSCLVAHVLNHRNDLQIVQLWHALGCMKKFGYAILGTSEGESELMARTMRMHYGYTAITISSFSFLRDFQEGFRTDGRNVYQIPLPRTDLLLSKSGIADLRRSVCEKYPEFGSGKTIVYCPTWRKDANAFENAAEALIEAFAARGIALVCSPHPVYGMPFFDERMVLYPDLSTQELLTVATAVVTDYSSVIYEAGLLGVPVYLYSYDWDVFNRAREFNLDLETDVPTVFSSDPDRIARAAVSEEFDEQAFKQFVAKNVVAPKSGTCCSAIVDLVDGRVSPELRCPEAMIRQL